MITVLPLKKKSPVSTTRPGAGAMIGVPVGAAMSIPECGLRDRPLNTRRRPKELERGPGTGCSRRRLEGVSSVKVSIALRRIGVSRATRAASSGERSTCRGATLRLWVA